MISFIRKFEVEMCTGMGMTGIPRVWKAGMRSSRGNWKSMLRGSRGDGKIARDSRGFNLLISMLLAETVHHCMNHYTRCENEWQTR